MLVDTLEKALEHAGINRKAGMCYAKITQPYKHYLDRS
jgi:hypothetical protein